MVKLVYFAWLRETIGHGEEMVELPADVKTAHDLLVWLAGRGEAHARALAVPSIIRVAVDQEMIQPDEFIGDASEIALFPPMTGG